MSEERKAKAAARKAARKQKNVEPIERKPLVAPAAEINVSTDIPKAEDLGSAVPVYGGTIEAATVTANDDNKPSPIVAKAQVQSPVGLAGAENNPILSRNTKSILPTEVPTATPEEKPQTWGEMLAGLKTTVQQDKTDAAKMQKYYALTDALNAIGKMGATAVGGKIGGNTLDSAMIVPEYKPSRGYLDAFEKAKQANDRLRALDEKEFQLKYNDAQRAEERAYKAELDELNRQWQKDMIDYRAKIDQATAEKNMALKAKYEKEMAEAQQQYWEERAAINHNYNMEEKARSEKIVAMQMAGKKKEEESPVPFTFHDLTKVDIPKHLYPELIGWALSKGKLGDDYVDKDNVEIILRKNPNLVKGFLNAHGIGAKADETSVVEEPVAEQKPKKSLWQSVAANPNQSALKVQKVMSNDKPNITVDSAGVEWEN